MPLFKNTNRWLYALLKTGIGGAAGGLTTSLAAKLAMPNTIVDFSDVWRLALCGAATSFILNTGYYLAKSPLPDEGDETKPPFPTDNNKG